MPNAKRRTPNAKRQTDIYFPLPALFYFPSCVYWDC